MKKINSAFFLWIGHAALVLLLVLCIRLAYSFDFQAPPSDGLDIPTLINYTGKDLIAQLITGGGDITVSGQLANVPLQLVQTYYIRSNQIEAVRLGPDNGSANNFGVTPRYRVAPTVYRLEIRAALAPNILTEPLIINRPSGTYFVRLIDNQITVANENISAVTQAPGVIATIP